MQAKVFFENSKGNKLVGILSNPGEDTNCPIAILCHGLNSGKDSKTNLNLEKAFSKHNIASLRFDFFAHKESEGNLEDRSVEEFVDDILKAIDYVKNKGYSKIGIYGGSFGGVAAVIAASKSSDLKVMALKAPGMGKTSRKLPNYKEDFDAKVWIMGGERVKIPTLIVHGMADEDVEIEFGEELAKSIEGSKLNIFPGADHLFSKEEDFEKMIKDISEFIIEKL